MYALVALGESLSASGEIPLEVYQIISNFNDIKPIELPDELPPLRDIQHAIDFMPRSSLPNLSHYRMNPIEQAELKRQVDELLRKSFIREKSMCCMHITHSKEVKKDGSWRMCEQSGHQLNHY